MIWDEIDEVYLIVWVECVVNCYGWVFLGGESYVQVRVCVWKVFSSCGWVVMGMLLFVMYEMIGCMFCVELWGLDVLVVLVLWYLYGVVFEIDC